MIPLVDMHCHLFAGLDDGPRTDQEAIDMCRMLVAEGVTAVAAVAHQNEFWPNTPAGIQRAATALRRKLQQHNISLRIVPTGEVMLRPDVVAAWEKGELLSVGNGGRYVLIEFPHGVYVDLTMLVQRFYSLGVRPILAHAERTPQLLYDPAAVERLIRVGCLVQVNADSVTRCPSREHTRAIKRWFKGNIVHLLGSDGHSPDHRPPLVAEAYRKIASWVGDAAADRICSRNGSSILEQQDLQVPPPDLQPMKRWFSRFW